MNDDEKTQLLIKDDVSQITITDKNIYFEGKCLGKGRESVNSIVARGDVTSVKVENNRQGKQFVFLIVIIIAMVISCIGTVLSAEKYKQKNIDLFRINAIWEATDTRWNRNRRDELYNRRNRAEEKAESAFILMISLIACDLVTIGIMVYLFGRKKQFTAVFQCTDASYVIRIKDQQVAYKIRLLFPQKVENKFYQI